MLTADGVIEGGEGGAEYLGGAWELDEDWLIGRGAVVDDELEPVSLLIAPAIFLDIPDGLWTRD
jgi:hypothetical protein